MLAKKSQISTIALFALLLAASSCQILKPKLAIQNITSEQENISLKFDNANYDLSYIKSGCAAINSDKTQENFSYISFFHLYLKVKSYGPDSLQYFDCKQVLEERIRNLLALDREPLSKINHSSYVDSYALHREVVRNLYKIIDVNKNADGEFVSASGINNERLFTNYNKDFFKEISNPKNYLKFYSYLDEKSGGYHEFYIPLKNYKLIKEYLLALNKKAEGGVAILL